MRLSPSSTPLLSSLTPSTFAALTALATLSPRPALAQSRASEVAAAQALFDEARGLAKAGRFTEACPKFEESERLDAGPGTEFNLADCYEHAGRTASAWAQFAAVADSLHAIGQREREKVARERAKALEPKLSRLAVNVSTLARVAGLEVKRDGEVLGDAQWGSAVPVDPGKHVIAAAAPGRQPWQQTVDVGGDAKNALVDVPVLAGSTRALAPTPGSATLPGRVTSVPSATASETEPPSHSTDGQKIAGLVIAGAGLVGLGIGGYFGSQAIAKHNQYTPICPNNLCTDPSGVELHNEASSDAFIATVTMTAGAVAVVGGVLLWALAPSAKSDAPKQARQAIQTRPRVQDITIAPSMSARGGGLTLQGSW